MVPFVLLEPVAKILWVVEYGIAERPKVVKGMVKIIIGHLGIAKRGIIGQGSSFLHLYFFGFAEGGIQEMDLAAAFQMGKAEMEDLFCRREIFEGGSKDDDVETAIFQQAGADVPMDEPEVGVVAEDPRSLLQFGKIDVDSNDRRAGYLRQLMGEPAIAAAYLEDIEGCLFAGNMANQPAAGLLSELPLPDTGMVLGDIGQTDQFLIGIQPAFQRPDLDVFLFEKNFSKPGMALNLNIG